MHSCTLCHLSTLFHYLFHSSTLFSLFFILFFTLTHTHVAQVREAQVQQYNFILVVGEKEKEAGAVNIRTRDNEVQGTVSIAEFVAKLAQLAAEYK